MPSKLTTQQKAVKNAKKREKRKAKKKGVAIGSKASGHGAYSLKDIGNFISAPFMHSAEGSSVVNRGARMLGGLLGEASGIPGASSALGNAASWFANKVLGQGSYTMPNYKVKSNSLLGGTESSFSTNGVPSFSTSGDGTVVRITHQEYIADITSSVVFSSQVFPINPANPLMFPWLSKIAWPNFEEYAIKGLIFIFKSTSATAVGSTNTALGTMVMATDMDVVDTAYSSKTQMEIADFAVSGPPCANYLHPVECDPSQNVLGRMFLNPATTVAGYPDDPRFSAMGTFQIASVGVQAASVIGELWVAYDVELRKPQILPSLSSSPLYSGHFDLVLNTDNSCSCTSRSEVPASIFTTSATYALGVNFNFLYTGGDYQRYLVCASLISIVDLSGHTPYTTTAGHMTALGGAALTPIGSNGHLGIHNTPISVWSSGVQVNGASYWESTQTLYSMIDVIPGSSFVITMGFPTPNSGLRGDCFIVPVNQLLSAPKTINTGKYDLQTLTFMMRDLQDKVLRLSSKDEAEVVNDYELDVPNGASSSSSSSSKIPETPGYVVRKQLK